MDNAELAARIARVEADEEAKRRDAERKRRGRVGVSCSRCDFSASGWIGEARAAFAAHRCDRSSG